MNVRGLDDEKTNKNRSPRCARADEIPGDTR